LEFRFPNQRSASKTDDVACAGLRAGWGFVRILLVQASKVGVDEALKLKTSILVIALIIVEISSFVLGAFEVSDDGFDSYAMTLLGAMRESRNLAYSKRDVWRSIHCQIL
jgi:hypothetical protein